MEKAECGDTFVENQWMDYQVKKHKREGYDFFLLDKRLCDIWIEKYGVGEMGPVLRKGVGDKNLACIEYKLKAFKVVTIPSKIEPITIYISRGQTQK